MDETLSTPSESKLPLILGVIALTIGASGLLFGLNGRSRAIDLEKQIAAAKKEAGQTPDVSTQVAAIQNTLDSIQREIDALKAFEIKAQTGLQQASSAFITVDEKVNRLAQIVGTRIGSGARPQPNQGGSTAPVVVGTDEYVVVSGDNFTAIARKNNVRLADLQAANPGVDSSRLKIGQKLKLPARN